MSKGSRVFTVRIEPALEAEMLAEINRRNLSPIVEEWTVGEWIRKAIREKIAHSQRSRREKSRVKPVERHDVAMSKHDATPCTARYYQWRMQRSLTVGQEQFLYHRLIASPAYRREWKLEGSAS